MAIRRVAKPKALQLHVRALKPEERDKVRHIHVDQIGQGVVESLKDLPNIMLVTHEPGVTQDQNEIKAIRELGVSVSPLKTPKKKEKKKEEKKLPEWYKDLTW